MIFLPKSTELILIIDFDFLHTFRFNSFSKKGSIQLLIFQTKTDNIISKNIIKHSHIHLIPSETCQTSTVNMLLQQVHEIPLTYMLNSNDAQHSTAMGERPKASDFETTYSSHARSAVLLSRQAVFICRALTNPIRYSGRASTGANISLALLLATDSDKDLFYTGGPRGRLLE